MENKIQKPSTEGYPLHDSKDFRRALGQFATGVCVITTVHQERKYGMTVNSFSAVSLSPALILWSIRKESNQLDAFINSERFSVNILSKNQVKESQIFSKGNPNCFDEVGFKVDSNSIPLINNSLAYFCCSRYQTYDVGDHFIIIGLVEKFLINSGEPLIFSQGQYSICQQHPDSLKNVGTSNLNNDINIDFSFIKNLSAASLKVSACFDSIRKKLGLDTATARLINRLNESNHSLESLEKISFIGKQELLDSLDELVEKKLVTYINSNDLTLTKKGAEIANLLTKEAFKYSNKITHDISTEELNTVNKVLAKLAIHNE